MHVVEAARRRRRRRPAQCAVVILAAWLPLGDKGTALSGAVAIDRIDRLLFVFNYISSGYHIFTSLSSADRNWHRGPPLLQALPSSFDMKQPHPTRDHVRCAPRRSRSVFTRYDRRADSASGSRPWIP